MKLSWIICIVLIILSAIFASYFGGNISYALFYLTIFTPIISFLYTVYVYCRFKLYQSIGNRVVVKDDWTLYSFVVANEDYVTFRNVKVNFLKDKSIIEAAKQVTEYSLLPNESERMETKLKCHYRGEYYVGVDSVEVTDFLYLFTIKYPILTKLKAIVLPRVIQLEHLGIAPPQMDVKSLIQHNNSSEEELDTDMRKYVLGDSRKRIHWKASAKQRELFSRKYNYKPKTEIILFMDLTSVKEEELQVIITEDKIIESILAIANYYTLQRTPSQIIYDMDGMEQVSIKSKEDFKIFYRACVSIRFHATFPVSKLIEEKMLSSGDGYFYVVATHTLTKDLYFVTLQVIARGDSLCVLFISDDITEKTKELVESFRITGATVCQILSEDEIREILSMV